MLPCILWELLESQSTMSLEVSYTTWVCFKCKVVITLYLGQLYVPVTQFLGKQLHNNNHFAVLSKLLHCASVTFRYWYVHLCLRFFSGTLPVYLWQARSAGELALLGAVFSEWQGRFINIWALLQLGRIIQVGYLQCFNIVADLIVHL